MRFFKRTISCPGFGYTRLLQLLLLLLCSWLLIDWTFKGFLDVREQFVDQVLPNRDLLGIKQTSDFPQTDNITVFQKYEVSGSKAISANEENKLLSGEQLESIVGDHQTLTKTVIKQNKSSVYNQKRVLPTEQLEKNLIGNEQLAKRQKLISDYKSSLGVKSNLKAAAEDKNSPEFKSVMNYNQNFSPHLTSDLYIKGYTKSHSELCKDSPVKVTILVISAPGHSKQRSAIRESWGKQAGGVVVAFFVGLSDNDTIAANVEKESNQFGDVVINNNLDLYENLSLKTISAFSWMLTYCPQSEFLLKVDDDMFVQVERLMDLIKSLNGDKNSKLIMGNISKGWKPVRNKNSKYYISPAQYGFENYPDFATGPSYLVSKKAVEETVPSALKSKYIHLEDVFITGVVAESIGVERRNIAQFKNNANRVPAKFMGCTIQHTITIHKVGPEEQNDLYELAKDGAECGKRKMINKTNENLFKKQLSQQWTQNKV